MKKLLILLLFSTIYITSKGQDTYKLYCPNLSDTTISSSILEFKDSCDIVAIFINKKIAISVLNWFANNDVDMLCPGRYVRIGDKKKNRNTIYYELRRLEKNLYYLKIW